MPLAETAASPMPATPVPKSWIDTISNKWWVIFVVIITLALYKLAEAEIRLYELWRL